MHIEAGAAGRVRRAAALSALLAVALLVLTSTCLWHEYVPDGYHAGETVCVTCHAAHALAAALASTYSPLALPRQVAPGHDTPAKALTRRAHRRYHARAPPVHA